MSTLLESIRGRPQLLGELLSEAIGEDTNRHRPPCPFCGSTSAFSIDLGRGLYHCFKCDAGGDALAFYQQRTGVDFSTAVQALGERIGALPDIRCHGTADRPSPRPRLLEAMDATARCWAAGGESLQAGVVWAVLAESLSLGDAAKTYLTARGLSADLAYAAGVRSIDDWSKVAQLLDHIGASEGFDLWDAYAAGLVRPGVYSAAGNGTAWQLREWVTPRYAKERLPSLVFVYRDTEARCVGVRFRGLVAERSDQAKTLSPRRVRGLTGGLPVPFGTEQLANVRGRVVHICEGEPDGLALRQLGALALGVPGARLIPRATLNPSSDENELFPRWMRALSNARAVTLWYDQDASGTAGAKAMGTALRAAGLAVPLRVVRWPDRRTTGTKPEDVNDLLRAGVLGEIVDAVERAA